ncbi:MAG: diaminopimelate epimerase [Alphaproteobacteria bacterium GM202ARS2]|nr:diaminopimelate epimerase [Alphaproteobacteria bacterium GM202ARS2]
MEAKLSKITTSHSDGLSFVKMHGLGNDFVIMDGRVGPGAAASTRALLPSFVRAVANRRWGVGCDQLIVLRDGQPGLADIFMEIYNADGGNAKMCGNAARCVGALLFQQDGKHHHVIETDSGLLDTEYLEDGRVRVDMGRARFDWRDIPLRDAHDTNAVPVAVNGLDLPTGVAVSMGNPHLILFVEDCQLLPLDVIGRSLGSNPLFPEGINIGLAQCLSKTHLHLRTWERGSGATLACGTNACAAAVAACRRNLTDRNVHVTMDGGTLDIEWLADDHVMMTGNTAISYKGIIPQDQARAWQAPPSPPPS